MLEHARCYTAAYARLLAPQCGQDRAAVQALHTLLGCIPTDQEDGHLCSAEAANRGSMRHVSDRLGFVAQLLHQGAEAAAEAGQCLPSEVLAAGLASIYHGIAILERAARCVHLWRCGLGATGV